MTKDSLGRSSDKEAATSTTALTSKTKTKSKRNTKVDPKKSGTSLQMGERRLSA